MADQTGQATGSGSSATSSPSAADLKAREDALNKREADLKAREQAAQRPTAAQQRTGIGSGVRQVPETKIYRLRQGKTHYHNGAYVTGGEPVPLTESQARAFRDKFEDPNGPVNPPETEKKLTDAVNKARSNHNAPKPTSPIAEDIGGKTPVGTVAPNATDDPEVRARAEKLGRG